MDTSTQNVLIPVDLNQQINKNDLDKNKVFAVYFELTFLNFVKYFLNINEKITKNIKYNQMLAWKSMSIFEIKG